MTSSSYRGGRGYSQRGDGAKASDSRFFLVYFFSRGFDKYGAHLELHVPGNLLARGDLSVLCSRQVKHHLEKKYRRR